MFTGTERVNQSLACGAWFTLLLSAAFCLKLLAMLYKKKTSLLNSHILHLTFSLVGSLDSGRESAIIPNKVAFEDLLCDLEVSFKPLGLCCHSLLPVESAQRNWPSQTHFSQLGRRLEKIVLGILFKNSLDFILTHPSIIRSISERRELTGAQKTLQA